jgi:hypothetical protein
VVDVVPEGLPQHGWEAVFRGLVHPPTLRLIPAPV